jgi:hypothetical protein
LIDYLQATVHHLAVLAVAQARQYEEIAGEVSELRARVDRSAAGGALMGSQLRFRADPVRHFEGRRDPRDRLEQLRADRREARRNFARFWNAWPNGISQKDINCAIDGYADDMLSALVYSVERDLEHESEADSAP